MQELFSVTKRFTPHILAGVYVAQKGSVPLPFSQVHGNVLWVPASQEEMLHALPEKPREADGIVVAWEALPATVTTADCLPLLFYSLSEPFVAAVHAGWRGALAGIAARALGHFTRVSDVRCIFGPGIGVCCYEVQGDFVDCFVKAGFQGVSSFFRADGKKVYFNLMDFIKTTQLRSLSLDQFHVDFYRCTSCSTPRLPSHRREGNERQASLYTWIKRQASFTGSC